MAGPRQITALTKQTAVEMLEVQELVQAARDDVAARVREIAARAKIASGAEREKLYDQIRKINAALGDSLDEWAKEMAGTVGLSFHELTVAEMKAAGKKLAANVVRFDRRRVETYLRLIHPDNAKGLAAVFTDKMTQGQISQLRQATVEVFRQSAVSNMTANEINKALQQRWNEIAGTVEFDRFKDRSGRTWANADYLAMLVRTTTARVARESAIDTQLGAGFDLARVRNVGDTCPICSAWDGVIISLSGGDKRFPSYQQSLNAGMWHPNCDCLHEYVDEAVDQAEIEKQAAAPNPDLKPLDGKTAREKAAAVAEYKAGFADGTRPVATQAKTFTTGTAAEEWGKQTQAAWSSGLKSAEFNALSSYQGYGHRYINAMMRGDDHYTDAGGKKTALTAFDRKQFGAEAKALKEAIDKAVLPEAVTVFRGTDAKEFDYPMDKLVGATHEWGQFTSTSLLKTQADKFATGKTEPVMMEIVAPAGTKAAYMNAALPKAHAAYERELLLQAGTRYRVQSVAKVKDKSLGFDVWRVKAEITP